MDNKNNIPGPVRSISIILVVLSIIDILVFVGNIPLLLQYVNQHNFNGDFGYLLIETIVSIATASIYLIILRDFKLLKGYAWHYVYWTSFLSPLISFITDNIFLQILPVLPPILWSFLILLLIGSRKFFREDIEKSNINSIYFKNLLIPFLIPVIVFTILIVNAATAFITKYFIDQNYVPDIKSKGNYISQEFYVSKSFTVNYTYDCTSVKGKPSMSIQYYPLGNIIYESENTTVIDIYPNTLKQLTPITIPANETHAGIYKIGVKSNCNWAIKVNRTK